MAIPLSKLLSIREPQLYKLHLACYNGRDQPLDVFVRERNVWDDWNRWRSTKDDFSRQFIFSLIEFYPEKDTWLFGGAYEVLARRKEDRALSYDIARLERLEPFVGRLKVVLKRPARGRAFNFENHFDRMLVSELLPRAYSGEAFAGYDAIDLSFRSLREIVASQRADWRAVLSNAKGVYLITDVSNGKRYVGSAYGASGLWSRWECYAGTGHGYNDELTRLIRKRGIEYAAEHFRFALLEHFTARTEDSEIMARESWWKEVLLTRGKFGYNRN